MWLLYNNQEKLRNTESNETIMKGQQLLLSLYENNAYVVGDSDTEDFDIFCLEKVGLRNYIFNLATWPSVSDEDGQLGDVRSRFNEQLCSCHAKRLCH